MKKKMFILAMVLIIIGVMNGCGKEKYAAAAIHEETDKCTVCSMQVKDDAFAVQLTTTDGKTMKFDDIGCMHKWTQEHGDAAIGAEYVRDYNSKDWVPFANASYVYDASFKTPMAYGIYSFKDEASAQAYVEEHKVGKLMKAEELNSHSWERNKDMMMHHKGKESGHEKDEHDKSEMKGDMHGEDKHDDDKDKK
ncbi:nitrous oxide reductase accessory protein NosL [Paenibacillus marinisediminis]